MDQKDRKILQILQGCRDIDERAGRSLFNVKNGCLASRSLSLEKSGVIKKRVTLLDQEALGFGLTVFALVRTNQHSDAWFSKFRTAVSSIPEILEFHRTSGDLDYLLRIVARDMRHYDDVYKRLIREVDFADVSSTFVMETFKSDTQLPI